MLRPAALFTFLSHILFGSTVLAEASDLRALVDIATEVCGSSISGSESTESSSLNGSVEISTDFFRKLEAIGDGKLTSDQNIRIYEETVNADEPLRACKLQIIRELCPVLFDLEKCRSAVNRTQVIIRAPLKDEPAFDPVKPSILGSSETTIKITQVDEDETDNFYQVTVDRSETSQQQGFWVMAGDFTNVSYLQYYTFGFIEFKPGEASKTLPLPIRRDSSFPLEVYLVNVAGKKEKRKYTKLSRSAQEIASSELSAFKVASNSCILLRDSVSIQCD